MSTTEFGRLWLISMCVAFAGMCPNVLADNWPGWRGPLQNGVSQETKVPTVWSKSQNVRWQVDIPGTGHSSPIVWDDAIFVTTSMPGDLTRHVLRVQRETGAVLWNKQVATSPIETMHRDNSPASSTPLTDGKRVYACFCVDGRLMVTALSMQGETVWTAYPGTFQSQHGFCTALVTDGQHLFVSGLQDGADAFVAALDCQTGETTWKVKRPHAIRSYSTPCLCEIDRQPALLLSGADQTIAYHRSTGATLWELAGPSEKTVSSIVVSQVDQLAFVCGGRDKKFFAIRL
ncbi:MAG: PQQ-binding-like beta-propeller repeat protein, partial [Pirellulaceae bacterium]|nr:PQQ-binding-like beta-propeller repeat protein [Pirellulaceae bacterium]